jgi:hypothetical protein
MTSNTVSGFGKSTDNAFNLDVDHLNVNQGEDISGTATFNDDVIFNGEITFEGKVQINDDVDVTGKVTADTFTATAATNQYTVHNASAFDFKVSTSTAPVFKFLDQNNSLATSTIEANVINATTINNKKTISIDTSNTTLTSSQKNTSISAGAEAGYAAINADNTSLGIYMQSTDGGKRGKVRTSSDAFGLDLVTSGYGLGNNKSIKLLTDHTTIDSALSCLQGLTVYGTSSFLDTVTIDATTNFEGFTNFNQDATFNYFATFEDQTTFNAKADFYGDVTMDDTLVVYGLTETQQLKVTEPIPAEDSITGAFQSNGGISVARKSFFKPNWEIPSGYPVPFDTILGGVVYENPIWTSVDEVTGPFVATTVYIKGPPALAAEIDPANQLLACSLVVEAQTQLDKVFVTGDVSIAGALTVVGLGTMNGAIILNGITTVNGSATFNGSFTIPNSPSTIVIKSLQSIDMQAGSIIDIYAKGTGLTSKFRSDGNLLLKAASTLTEEADTIQHTTTSYNVDVTGVSAKYEVESANTIGISSKNLLKIESVTGNVQLKSSNDMTLESSTKLELKSTSAMEMTSEFTFDITATDDMTLTSKNDKNISVNTNLGAISLNTVGGSVSTVSGGGQIEINTTSSTGAGGIAKIVTGGGNVEINATKSGATSGDLLIDAGKVDVDADDNITIASTKVVTVKNKDATGRLDLFSDGDLNIESKTAAKTLSVKSAGPLTMETPGVLTVKNTNATGKLELLSDGDLNIESKTAAQAMNIKSAGGLTIETPGLLTVKNTNVASKLLLQSVGDLDVKMINAGQTMNIDSLGQLKLKSALRLEADVAAGGMSLKVGAGALDIGCEAGITTVESKAGALNLTSSTLATAGAVVMKCVNGPLTFISGDVLTPDPGIMTFSTPCEAGAITFNLFDPTNPLASGGVFSVVSNVGAINLSCLGGVINLLCGVGIINLTAGVGSIQINAEGVAGGDAVKIGSGSGNISVAAGTGALNLLANQGGINVGCTSETDFTKKTAHFIVRTVNTAFAAGTANITFSTHSEGELTGPGNFTVDTSSAYLGNIFLRSRGSFQVVTDNGSETGGVYFNTVASNSPGESWTWKFPNDAGLEGQVLTSGGSNINPALAYQTWTTVTKPDANGNVSANNFFSSFFTLTNATLSPYEMTPASPAITYSTRTGAAENVFLPDATLLPKGATFYFNINGTATINVKRFGSGTIASLKQETFTTFELTDNTTAAGTWDHHHELPSNVDWTNSNVTFPQTLTMTNTTQTTSKTTGSIVTAGGLATAKSIWCGSGNLILENTVGNHITVRPQTGAFTNYDFVLPISLGTSGQVFTSQGTGTAPIWTTPTSGTVTSIGMSVPTFLSVSPSTITTSGTFAVTLSGTALPVLNGGTGVTTSTGTGSNVLSTTPTFTSGIVLAAATSGNITFIPPATVTSWSFIPPTTSGTTGQVLTSAAGSTMTWTTPTTGTVTSVGMSVPTFLSVSPSSITSSGTFAVTLSGTALPIANGGTGTTTSTGTGSNVLSITPTITSGIVLAAATSGNITFIPPATVTSWSFIPPTTSGTTGQFLTSAAGGTMTWTTPSGAGSSNFTTPVTTTLSGTGTQMAFQGLIPSLVAPNDIYMQLGVNSTVNNNAYIAFQYVGGSGSANNRLNFGLQNSQSLSIGPANTTATFSTTLISNVGGTGSQIAFAGLVSSLATGNNVSLQFGDSQTTNDCGVIYFKNTGGGGSALNEVILGLYNNDIASFQNVAAIFYKPIRYTNLVTTTTVDAFSAIQGALGTGNAVNINFGQLLSTNSCAVIQFVNTGGGGSANNSLNLGLFGSASLILKPTLSTFNTAVICKATGTNNGLNVYPNTTNAEASISFWSQSTDTGNRWITGQAVGGTGANTFGLYSTSYGGWVQYFDVSAGAAMWTRGVIKSNGDFLMTADTANNRTFQMRSGSYQNGGLFLNAQTSGSYAALPANGRGSTNIGNDDIGNCLFVGANQEKYIANSISANGIANVSSTSSNFQLITFYRINTTTKVPNLAVGNIAMATPTATAISYNTTSDYRVKENVNDVYSGLDIISALRPVTYTSIDDITTQYGFLAHEVQEIIPTIVMGEKDALDEYEKPLLQGMDYGKLTPFLTKAVQELLAKIELLESRIAILEST